MKNDDYAAMLFLIGLALLLVAFFWIWVPLGVVVSGLLLIVFAMIFVGDEREV